MSERPPGATCAASEANAAPPTSAHACECESVGDGASVADRDDAIAPDLPALKTELTARKKATLARRDDGVSAGVVDASRDSATRRSLAAGTPEKRDDERHESTFSVDEREIEQERIDGVGELARWAAEQRLRKISALRARATQLPLTAAARGVANAAGVGVPSATYGGRTTNEPEASVVTHASVLPSRGLRRAARALQADELLRDREKQQRAAQRIVDRNQRRLEQDRKHYVRRFGSVEPPESEDPRIKIPRELFRTVQLLIFDTSGLRARLGLQRMRHREFAASTFHAAVVPLGDGTCRQTVAGTSPGALRARRIVALGVILDELATSTYNRPGVVGLTRGVGVCLLLRMIRDVSSDSEPVCPQCKHRHPSRSAFHHRGPDDSNETGDVGYIVALEQAGALARFQHRHPAKIPARCKSWEIGTSGYPYSWYFIFGRTNHRDLPVGDIIHFSALRDRADEIEFYLIVRCERRALRALRTRRRAEGCEPIAAPP